MHLEVIKLPPEIDKGKPPVLFIHGAWHGAWCWAEYFLPYFAKQGYYSCAFSLRGHGKSNKTSDFRWSLISDYVADVRQIALELPGPPILIGHSMGGLVTQRYLQQYQAEAAVLMAPIPVNGLLNPVTRLVLRHPLLFLWGHLRLGWYPFVHTKNLARELFYSENIPDEKLDKYFPLLCDESYLILYDGLRKISDTGMITCPILVLGAENDALFKQAEITTTAEAYNIRAHIFPDMAHNMMLEKNWKTVADYILDWLNKINL